MTLFQIGDYTLNSGLKSEWKIDCDALTDEDIETLAYIASQRLPPFSDVVGIPRGGLRLAKAMEQYTSYARFNLLICDDVYTTGGSMRRAYEEYTNQFPSISGLVIFDRNIDPLHHRPHWITRLFSSNT